MGYNGTAPGPTYMIEKGTETIIRYLNNGDVTASIHLHGSYTHAAWDGWASDQIEPGQWKDYYYPNSETARPIWYHDHAEGHTASDAYYGQAGVYIIYDPAEDSLGLPSGDYDVPLAITDKTYQANGDLASPTGDPMNFFGDVIQVNEQPWPYMAVEPRKYRLRFYDMSLSRPYDLYFEDPSGNRIEFQVIASDSGLFGGPVSSEDLVISMGERYEVVIDFSPYAGMNISLNNNMQLGAISEFSNTDQVMRFVVGNSVSDNSNNGPVPSTLNGNIQWPAQRTTVDHYFNFQLGGDAMWTINGVGFADMKNRVLARPPQGTVELWELHHTGGPAVHPVHVHLVNFQVVSRTGGSRGVLPYEAAGLKDVVLLEPGETVQVLAFYGPWNGLYMFHCKSRSQSVFLDAKLTLFPGHNLVHEDNMMMDAFNTTMLSALGYEFNSTQLYADPSDTRFSPQEYNAEAFSPAAISSAVVSLASLNPYASASALIAAEDSYYATAGYNGDASSLPSTTAVPASSTGSGVATSMATSSSSGSSLARSTTTASTLATQVRGRPMITPGRPAGRPGH